MSSLPTQTQLAFPLLEVLSENGGKSSAAEATAAIAAKLQLAEELVAASKTLPGTGRINLLQRRVRWTKQTLVQKELIAAATPHNVWELTEKGKDALQNAQPGVIVTIYETPQGIALWAEAEAAVSLIGQKTLQLILTSPPYPLIRQKEYSAQENQKYLDWLVGLAREWKPKLKEDGSLLLNLADCWNPGEPTLNLYQEELLLRLQREVGYCVCQKLYWHSPSKIPSSNWVTVRRCRLNNSVESLFWLSNSPAPKTRPENVLKPYSASMLRSLRKGGDFRKERPSTHGGTQGGFGKDHGGAIPFTLLQFSHAQSQNDYFSFCKENGLPIHPARFPADLPEFGIKYLTDPGDRVYDPFAGKNTTGHTAEKLGRTWLSNEKSLSYILGGMSDFQTLELAN